MKLHIGVDVVSGWVHSPGHHARPRARSDPGTGAATRVRTPGVGGCRLSGPPQAAGTPGPGRAMARRPAARGAPHLGPGQPGGAGGAGQILTAGPSRASVSHRETALRLRQSPLPRPAQKPATTGPAAGISQSVAHVALSGRLTRAARAPKRAQTASTGPGTP